MARAFVALMVALASVVAPVLAFQLLRLLIRPLTDISLGAVAGIGGLFMLVALAGPLAGFWSAVGLLRLARRKVAAPELSAPAVVEGAWLGFLLGLVALLGVVLVLGDRVTNAQEPWLALGSLGGFLFLGSFWGARPAARVRRNGRLGCLGAFLALLFGPTSLFLVYMEWEIAWAERARSAVAVGTTAVEAIAAAEVASPRGIAFRAECFGIDGATVYWVLRGTQDHYSLFDMGAEPSRSDLDRSELQRRLAARDAKECASLLLGSHGRHAARFHVRLEAGRVREIGPVSFVSD